MSNSVIADPESNVSLAYSILVIGSRDSGAHHLVSKFLKKKQAQHFSASFLRPNQKAIELPDGRILALDIVERSGDFFRECCGSSYQHVINFHEQLVRSKWASLPTVLYGHIRSRRGVRQVQDTESRQYAEIHGLTFVEAPLGRMFDTPILTLLDMVRKRHETPSQPISIAESIKDFLTVAAAKVAHPRHGAARKAPTEQPQPGPAEPAELAGRLQCYVPPARRQTYKTRW
ncbi:hypothetical protein BC834DRAFT_847483 [Gloeopeniophorella convolvens]|nr:hypothetical protein BC834DRAFT_847483 [Gloeopeniophorella convolvens]